jgi:hypothetical protein
MRCFLFHVLNKGTLALKGGAILDLLGKRKPKGKCQHSHQSINTDYAS